MAFFGENSCDAWVNFVGTGTVSIRDSYNVSRFTDHGTGDYSVEWDGDFSNNDYLLLIGDPSIIGIACSVASDINMGYYKVLKWDRKREKYHPIEIDIRRNKNDENKL